MKPIFSMIVFAGLIACSPPVPDSGAGVGFKDYDTYLAEQRARDQALRTGQTVTVRPPETPVNPATDPVVVVVQQTPEQQTASAAVAAVRPQAAAQPVQTAAAPSTDNPNLSDEQDFQAVSGRQSIQSDAQRRQAQSAQYQVIAPTALPSRPRGGTQTPIEFAVATRHPIGQKVYSRSPFGGTNKFSRACAQFTSGEAAQDAFLKAGGPKRDKLGVDPDGDGYACRWDPSVYRVARGG